MIGELWDWGPFLFHRRTMLEGGVMCDADAAEFRLGERGFTFLGPLQMKVLCAISSCPRAFRLRFALCIPPQARVYFAESNFAQIAGFGPR